MRQLIGALTAFAMAASTELLAQDQAPARWTLGVESIAGPGLTLGPSLSASVLQWPRDAIEVYADALWQVDPLGPIVCRLTCPVPNYSIGRLATLGIRWTAELEGNLYGVVTASLAEVQWARPTRETDRTLRLGMGSGIKFNKRGDAVEVRVETLNSPDGREYALALGMRRKLAAGRAVAEKPVLGVRGERTVRAELRRTRSGVELESGGLFQGKVGGGRGIAPAVSVRQRTHRLLSVEAGAAYVEKGHGHDDRPRMNYVEFPLLANIEPQPVTSRLQVFVTAGVAPAVLESCTQRNPPLLGGATVRCGSTVPGSNTAQDFQRFDISRELRAGARVNVGVGRVVAMYTGSRSLVNFDAANAFGNKSFHNVGSWGIGFERAF